MLSLEFGNVHLVYRMFFFDMFGFVIFDGFQIQQYFAYANLHAS